MLYLLRYNFKILMYRALESTEKLMHAFLSLRVYNSQLLVDQFAR